METKKSNTSILGLIKIITIFFSTTKQIVRIFSLLSLTMTETSRKKEKKNPKNWEFQISRLPDCFLQARLTYIFNSH